MRKDASSWISFVCLLTTFGLPGVASAQAEEPRFSASFSTRGDVDGTGTVEIHDALSLLDVLFSPESSALECPAAADVNADGSLDVTDAIYLMRFLLAGGLEPPQLFAECGTEPSRGGTGAKELQAARIALEAPFVPEQLIIGFRRGVTDDDIAEFYSAFGFEEEEDLDSDLEDDDPEAVLLSIPTDVSRELIEELTSHPLVEFAEPNYLLYAIAAPNDPRYGEEWGLNNTGQTGGTLDADIDAPEAWDITTGSASVVVGVVDTGVQVAPGFSGSVSTHPDLAANLWVNPGEIAGDGIDNDGNGYVDDIHGWNFYDNASWIFYSASEDSHGTHVSGTIAATGNNGIGVAGVNWQARLMALKFIGPGGTGSTSDAIAAINYAANKGVQVINASWGGGGSSQALKDAIEACNCVFVAAAGNGGADQIGDNNDTTPFYPSSYDSSNLIAVAATDHNDDLASFSNFGIVSVDLGAPGVSVLSTVPFDTYDSYSGTSMATPHVSGVAALVYSQFPGLTPVQVKNQILSAVDPIPPLNGITVTGGRLNAFGAVSGGPPPPPPPPPPEPVVIAFDDFESGGFSGGTGWLGPWTNSGDARIRSREGPYSGNYHARLRRGTGYIETSVDLSGNSNVQLSFWAKVYSFEGSDYAEVLVSSDGSTWTVIKTFTAADSDNIYHSYELDLSSFAMSSQFHVAFDAQMSSRGDRWFLDDVKFINTGPPDSDGDGVPDNVDNCPNTPNPGQEDTDGDGV